MAQPNTKPFLAKVSTKENTSKDMKPVSNPKRVGIMGKPKAAKAC